MTWPTLFDARIEDFNAMDLPGHQLPATTATSNIDHLINLDIKSAPGCQRLTAIMASMGRSTNDVEIMQKMMEAGMNIALLNMSFGTREEHVNTIHMLRQAAKNFSVNMGADYPVTIAVQLSGRKIRTGRIAESLGDSVEIEYGETVRLTTDYTYKDRCSPTTVFIDFVYFAQQLIKGATVLLDNETIELKVEMISASTLTCRVERGGTLGSYKDVFVPNVVLDMPNFPEKIKLDVEMAIAENVDFIIASFVSSGSIVNELRSILKARGREIPIIANIQTIAGYNQLDEILKITNAIMITRQELGSDITPKKLVIAQKNIIARANQANIPVSVNAHILNSMRENKTPTRAELMDIANCILDGADCLVLGPETAVGANPVETVHYMAQACAEAEACIWSKQVFSDLMDKTPSPCDQLTGIAMAAVLASQRSLAPIIIAITNSGKTAAYISKFKPRCPILAMTKTLQVAKQLHMWRGVIPLYRLDTRNEEWEDDLQKRVDYGLLWATERGIVKVADPVVVVYGWVQGSGYTNTMRVIYVTPNNNAVDSVDG